MLPHHLFLRTPEGASESYRLLDIPLIVCVLHHSPNTLDFIRQADGSAAFSDACPKLVKVIAVKILDQSLPAELLDDAIGRALVVLPCISATVR